MIIQLGDHAPAIADSAWIAPTATVIGQVSIAGEVSIWYGAVVRADAETIAIGARSNIQDGCALHCDPGFPLQIGAGVSVGHNAILHGCTVGDDVLIGMGATVLNGAVIGAGALIAANALITAGTEIPPRTMVAGVPGKVRRELSADEIEGIRFNARAYQALRSIHESARVL